MNMNKHKVKQTLHKEIFFKRGFFPLVLHMGIFFPRFYIMFSLWKKKIYQFKRFPLPGNNKRNSIGAESLTPLFEWGFLFDF